MFEKFMEKFAKKEFEKDEMEFKPFEQTQRAEVAAPQIKEVEAPVHKPQENHSSGVELKVIRPESYEEVRTVADNLIAGCTVVLNVEAQEGKNAPVFSTHQRDIRRNKRKIRLCR